MAFFPGIQFQIILTGLPKFRIGCVLTIIHPNTFRDLTIFRKLAQVHMIAFPVQDRVNGIIAFLNGFRVRQIGGIPNVKFYMDLWLSLHDGGEAIGSGIEAAINQAPGVSQIQLTAGDEFLLLPCGVFYPLWQLLPTGICLFLQIEGAVDDYNGVLGLILVFFRESLVLNGAHKANAGRADTGNGQLNILVVNILPCEPGQRCKGGFCPHIMDCHGTPGKGKQGGNNCRNQKNPLTRGSCLWNVAVCIYDVSILNLPNRFQ